jgi:uncharacterized protein
MKKQHNIRRKIYLQRVAPFIGKNIIKVFTGQRRVGKSFLMLQLMDQISKSDSISNIIYINKELFEFKAIRDYNDLHSYFIEHRKTELNNYLFIDEIQEINSFEKCIRSILALNEADIYITGSNADMLSGDLATLLSGRYIEINVNTLSYGEFLLFNRLKDSNLSFERYLKYGGMPGLIHIDQIGNAISDYLQGIYSTVLFKDVIARYNIRNVVFLENLVSYLADNTGNIVSAKKISDFLKSQRVSVTPNIVLDYLNYLTKAYFVAKVNRADPGGKKIFEIGEKYYFEDLGIRNFIAGYKPGDLNKILENVVYLHLKVAGYKIFIGKLGEKEIDFICERAGEKIYVQVCYLLSDERVIEREFGNLMLIKDNYPKYVVSMDKIETTTTFKGIKNMHIKDFCLMLLEKQ